MTRRLASLLLFFVAASVFLVVAADFSGLSSINENYDVVIHPRIPPAVLETLLKEQQQKERQQQQKEQEQAAGAAEQVTTAAAEGEDNAEKAAGATSEANGDDGGEFIPLQLPNGTKYTCFIPSTDVLREGLEGEAAGATNKLQVGEKVPLQMNEQINGMAKDVCISKLAGWWMYEVCWDRHVRQYHQNAQTREVETEFFLGKGPQMFIKKGTRAGDLKYGHHNQFGPYVAITYYNGTVCDLTKRERQTELRFYCGENGNGGEGIEITEPETCTYLIWMWHSSACVNDLKKNDGVTHQIDCYQLPEEQQGAPIDRLDAPPADNTGPSSSSSSSTTPPSSARKVPTPSPSSSFQKKEDSKDAAVEEASVEGTVVSEENDDL